MLRTVFAATAITLATMMPAHANLVSNGSFETGTDPGSSTTLAGGSTAINRWTIGGTVDYVGDAWDAQQGNRSVELSGTSAGSVRQTVRGAVLGQKYRVSFHVGRNGDGTCNKRCSITVRFGKDASGIFRIGRITNVINAPATSDDWVLMSFVAVLEGNKVLRFSTASNTGFGPVIDNVSVSAVPLPGALPLLATALAGGAFAGCRLRFRKGGNRGLNLGL